MIPNREVFFLHSQTYFTNYSLCITTLKVSDRKTYRDELRKKYKDSFIKFSRNYAGDDEAGIRAGWFCIPEAKYEEIYNSNKYKHFFFIINANPDIEQEDGVCIHFGLETIKKYFDKKEGDNFAVNKDKNGKKLYQFYLRYEKDEKKLSDTRVKSGNPLEIELLQSSESDKLAGKSL